MIRFRPPQEITPGDPDSGKPFEYEKTDDHFILRCPARRTPERTEADHFEFKIKR